MMCVVCIPDRENLPCPTPRQLSALPRQWPCAWCHGPWRHASWSLGAGVGLTPTNPLSPFNQALKPLFQIESLIILYDHSWPHTQTERGKRRRQHSKAMSDRTRKRRDILSPVCLFPNIASFPVPLSLLFLLWWRFLLIKDVDMRSGVGKESRLVEMFVWLFGEWCFDGVCKCRGKLEEDDFCRLETPGWPVTVFRDTRLVRVSGGKLQRGHRV